MLKMKRIISAFLLIITLICNCPCNVYASSNLSGWDNWTVSEKASYIFTVVTDVFSGALGFVASQGENTQDVLLSYLRACYDDIQNETQTYEEWLASRLDVQQNESTGEYELIIDDELMDLMYSASLQYIEEETGYFVIPTLCASDLLASDFYNKDTYDLFKNYINNLGSDICFVYGGGTSSGSYIYQLVNGTATRTNDRAYSFYRIGHDWGIVKNQISNNGWFDYLSSPSVYDSDWNLFSSLSDIEIDFITLTQTQPFCNTSYEYNAENGDYFIQSSNVNSIVMASVVTFTPSDNTETRIFTADGRDIRIYKTLDDFKNYSVGQRPYYVTEKFVNYDSSVDNSTTITQTEIDNSITYGDVVTYIINNYENPDGLTEDELRAILDEYLSQIGGGSGGGSGGGGSGGSDDDSGGSGGGLSGFLDGLGAIGNAILAILGKLMEILGSAIELVTGSITDLITIIPNSIGELLGALFPVFPEEWIKAITLSLVLGVIVGIVRIFK